MRHAKKLLVALVFTTTFFNNCSSFKPLNMSGVISNSSTNIDTPPPPSPQGVDPSPTATPTAMGTPMPDTNFPKGPVLPTPTPQAQLAKIVSNFNVNDWIGSYPLDDVRSGYFFPDTVGAFRFICKPSHNLYDDPIVYPGQAGASHLHTFFGNTMTNANSTYESLRQTGDGTCNGGPINRSAYWMPSLQIDDGDGNVLNDKIVMPDFTIIYYKMSPEKSTVFLRGMRMIFGYDMNDPAKSSGFKWVCIPPAGSSFTGFDSDSIKGLADGNCPGGSQIEVLISGPTCWDGRLDSPDHRSHMAFPSYGSWGYGACPTSHPLSFVAFTLGAMFTVGPDGPAELRKMYLSSDKMRNSVPGTTFHTDWFGAWDDDILAEWMVNANADFRNTASGNFGNGRGLVDPYQKTGKDGYNSLLDRANPRLVSPPQR